MYISSHIADFTPPHPSCSSPSFNIYQIGKFIHATTPCESNYIVLLTYTFKHISVIFLYIFFVTEAYININ